MKSKVYFIREINEDNLGRTWNRNNYYELIEVK